MCEGLLRTHAPLEACLLAIFASHSNEFALSQVYIWGGISGGHDLLHLKGIWRSHLETWPSQYLPVLINFGICLNCSGFSKSCQSRKSYNVSFPPCCPPPPHLPCVLKRHNTTDGYKSCLWNRNVQMEIQSQLWPKAKTNRKIDPNWVCVCGGWRGRRNSMMSGTMDLAGVGWRCWEGINKNSIRITSLELEDLRENPNALISKIKNQNVALSPRKNYESFSRAGNKSKPSCSPKQQYGLRRVWTGKSRRPT